MKRNTIFAAILTLCAVPALAGPHGPGHEPDFNRMAEKLGLEEAQVEPFTTIMQEQFEKNRARREAHRQMIEENGRSPELRDALQEQRKIAQQETLDAVSGVLNAEQLTRFEEFMAQRGPGRRGKHGGHGRGSRDAAQGEEL